MLKLPKTIESVLESYETEDAGYGFGKIQDAIAKCIQVENFPEDEQAGFWAEHAAFAFHTNDRGRDSVWGVYFGPLISQQSSSGVLSCRPDIKDATEATIDHWKDRAQATNNARLKARYADLAWTFENMVTGNNSDICMAKIAIEGYLEYSTVCDDEWSVDCMQGLGRATQISLSIKDPDMVERCLATMIDYCRKTLEFNSIGTYVYLFDEIVVGVKKHAKKHYGEILKIFEQGFSIITDESCEGGISPLQVRSLGDRLSKLYLLAGQGNKSKEVLVVIAQLLEKRARAGGVLDGLSFYRDAKLYFLSAGDKENANRMDVECEKIAPNAKSEMACHEFEIEVTRSQILERSALLLEEGVEVGLQRWGVLNVPSQEKIFERKRDCDRQFPIQSILGAQLIGERGIEADIRDSKGDEFGLAVYETSKHLKMFGHWIFIDFDQLMDSGLKAIHIMEHVEKSVLYTEDRYDIIYQGLSMHWDCEYLAAVHIIVPQIERAIVECLRGSGIATGKEHRSGKAVTIQKSINDTLENEAVQNLLTADWAIYLMTVLSHQKGINARNAISHGLWGQESFSRHLSIMMLHCLYLLAQVRRPDETDKD